MNSMKVSLILDQFDPLLSIIKISFNLIKIITNLIILCILHIFLPHVMM